MSVSPLVRTVSDNMVLVSALRDMVGALEFIVRQDRLRHPNVIDLGIPASHLETAEQSIRAARAAIKQAEKL